MQLSKVIFWDTDYNKIDWEAKSSYVISRVLMYGTMDDWRAIKQKYGDERILNEMKNSIDLDMKVLTFLSCIFETPITEFKCYTQIQSTKGHWIY
jgi:hypothetical protein